MINLHGQKEMLSMVMIFSLYHTWNSVHKCGEKSCKKFHFLSYYLHSTTITSMTPPDSPQSVTVRMCKAHKFIRSISQQELIN